MLFYDTGQVRDIGESFGLKEDIIETVQPPLPLLVDGLAVEDRHRAIELVRQGPAVTQSLDSAADFVAQAKQVLGQVSNNQAASALAGAADHLLLSVTAIDAV